MKSVLDTIKSKLIMLSNSNIFKKTKVAKSKNHPLYKIIDDSGHDAKDILHEMNQDLKLTGGIQAFYQRLRNKRIRLIEVEWLMRRFDCSVDIFLGSESDYKATLAKQPDQRENVAERPFNSPHIETQAERMIRLRDKKLKI